MTKRKSALPDAKRDPEMGQSDSPWPTYGGSANYTMGPSGTVWPLHMGAGMPENGCYFRERYRTETSLKSMAIDSQVDFEQ